MLGPQRLASVGESGCEGEAESRQATGTDGDEAGSIQVARRDELSQKIRQHADRVWR